MTIPSKELSGGKTSKTISEANLLMDTLTELSRKGKYVFVLYEAQDISIDIINGVRYISTGTYSSDITKDPLKIFRYIEFNISEEETTYQVKSLFE